MKNRLLPILAVLLSLAVSAPAPAADFTIKEIQFEATDSPERSETVHVLLNALLYPKTFALMEGTPRVVCDFISAEPAKDINRTIEVNGRYVKRIRTGFHDNPETKTRVVLDLVPNRDYIIQQVASSKNNRLSIVVRVAAEESLPTADDQTRDK